MFLTKPRETLHATPQVCSNLWLCHLSTQCPSMTPRSGSQRLLAMESRSGWLSATPRKRGDNPCIPRAPPFRRPPDGRGTFRRNEPSGKAKKTSPESAKSPAVRPEKSPAGQEMANRAAVELHAALPSLPVALCGRRK